jgi:hypothetical protein
MKNESASPPQRLFSKPCIEL